VSCSAQLAPNELDALAEYGNATSDDVLGKCSLIGALVDELLEEPVLREDHTLPKETI